MINETWNNIGKNIEKNKVEQTINAFIKIIGSEIKNGNVVKIEGLGRFYSSVKRTRGKNINTGKIQEIHNAQYIHFIPSSKLKT